MTGVGERARATVSHLQDAGCDVLDAAIAQAEDELNAFLSQSAFGRLALAAN